MDYRSGKCSQCGAEYKVPASFAHNVARCKVCKGVVHLGPATGARAEGGAPLGARTPERRQAEQRPAVPRAPRPSVPEAPRPAAVAPAHATTAREPASIAPAASSRHQPEVAKPRAEGLDAPAASPRSEPRAREPKGTKKLSLGAALSAAGLVVLLLVFLFRERLFPGAEPAPATGAGAPGAVSPGPTATPEGGGPTAGDTSK